MAGGLGYLGLGYLGLGTLVLGLGIPRTESEVYMPGYPMTEDGVRGQQGYTASHAVYTSCTAGTRAGWSLNEPSRHGTPARRGP